MFQKNKIERNENKLLFIDAGVLDAEILLKDLRPGYRVIWLDPESEPIAQLTHAIHAYAPVEEVVLVVHAIPGQIHFSGGLVGTEELEWHRQQLQTWRESLSTDAKLCIYACQLAADKEGLAFIDTLKDFTGAEVAASSLQMGNTGKGKNWNFDRFTTFFSASNPFHQDSLLNYAHTLESVISVNRSASALHVSEGNTSSRYLEFTVTLSEPATNTVRIYYRTLDDAGTATGEVDYNEASSYIQIAAGQSSGTVYVQVYGDTADEADESVVLELYNPSNAVFADGVNTLQAIGLIHDDDGVGNDLGLFVGNSEIVEGADGVTREVAVPIHLSRPSDQTLTFQYQTADSSAIAGQDYIAQTGTVTFLPGQTSAAAIIPIIGDAIDEPSETFTLTVTPTAAIANGSDGATGTVTILDGDVAAPPAGITVSAGGNTILSEGSLFTRTITFIDDVDTNADGWTYSVDWGDGTAAETGSIAAGANSFDISRFFADGDASHTVSVTVTDTTGDMDTQQFQLNVNNVAPTIALLGAETVHTGVSYTLNLGAITDPGQDTVTGYIVNWGDGNIETFSSAGDVTHVYSTAGNTTITVDLVDEDGTYSNAGSLTVVVNTPPAGISLDAGENASLNEGNLFTRTILFTDGEDTDADGWTYSIDWGDGSAAENGAIAAGVNSFNISRIFADGDASHTVSVTVTDTAGDTDTQQFQLDVNNVVPTIALSGLPEVDAGVSYTLNLGAITDPGDDTVTSYIINWGDNSSDTYDTAGEVTHTFAADGNYTISVDLVDEDDTHTAAGTLAVAVNPAVIPDGVSVNAGIDAVINEGSVFTRTITFSDGEDTGGDGWTYSVDWGDGSVIETGSIAAGISSFDISRFFVDGNASHNVSVTVTDVAGDSDTRQFRLDVNNVVPVITLIGDASVDEGSVYTLTGSVFDPGLDTITDYIVNWGDGTTTALTAAEVQALSGNVSHVFADGASNPLISVDLVDEDGTHTAAGTLSVTVNNVAPIIALSGAVEVNTGDSYTLNLGAVTDPGDDMVTSYIVNWGDGTADTFSAAGDVAHVYSAAGSNTIRVDLIDEDGTHVDAGNLAVSVNAPSPVEIIRIGDAPLRVSRSDPDVWENAWTNEKIAISHKADYLNTTEAWSSAALNGNNPNVLNGGDIFGGDLGVSGQSLTSSTIHQEIDGTEALRFDLDQAATKVTIDLSRLDGNSSTGHFDAGRLQLLDDAGLVVDELIFNADALSSDQQITLDHATGFSSVVLTSGVYNGADFIFGGLSDANGQYLSGPQNQGNGTWNASEYLVDA
ncbi:MAG: DUF4347 domain-containing protein, partial [Nitrosomonas sp.]|nr:DUF4347 domain-containing protein [Nitrosomonas sp.]